MNKDVYLKEYRRFPHGLWSFASSFGIKECQYAVSDAAAWIKELIAKREEDINGRIKIIGSIQSNPLQQVNI